MHRSFIGDLLREENNIACIVTVGSESLEKEMHWLHVKYRITYKMAVITFEVRSTGQLQYLKNLILDRVCDRVFSSTETSLLSVPVV